MTTETVLSRRAMLVKIGVFFNFIVGAILAVPIVRYLMSPVARGRAGGYLDWLSLGGLEEFPAGQIRLATYRNPIETGGMGRPPISPAGSGTSMARIWSLLTARTSMSGALVPAVKPVHVSVSRRRPITRMVSRVWASRRADCFPAHLQGRGWKTPHQGRRNADDREPDRVIER